MQAPLDLPRVIAEVESHNSPRRPRFEPLLYGKWATPTPERSQILRTITSIHDCSYDTARMIACTSWGRYQLLGENLYAPICGVHTDIFTFVASDQLQDAALERFLRAKGIFFTVDDLVADRTKREQFIAAYNGPGAVDAYWADMQAAIARLRAEASPVS